MKLVIAITGASGSIYAQRLLDRLDPERHEVHITLSKNAGDVAQHELGGFRLHEGMQIHSNDTMRVPFVSGSARFDAMVIIPCSMGVLGRIASGISDSTITRAADVFLKERRKLILVPREMPWSLVHARNVVSLLEAGATIMPASPSFYGKPQTLEEAVDTVVGRVLDHLGIENWLIKRWLSPEPHHLS